MSVDSVADEFWRTTIGVQLLATMGEPFVGVHDKSVRLGMSSSGLRQSFDTPLTEQAKLRRIPVGTLQRILEGILEGILRGILPNPATN
jgi:hypothetical protein